MANGWVKTVLGFIFGIVLALLSQMFISSRSEGAVSAEVGAVKERVIRLEESQDEHQKEFREIISQLSRIEAKLDVLVGDS